MTTISSLTLADGVDARRLAAEINRRAHTAGIVLAELHHQRADLEARYLELVNRNVDLSVPRPRRPF